MKRGISSSGAAFAFWACVGAIGGCSSSPPATASRSAPSSSAVNPKPSPSPVAVTPAPSASTPRRQFHEEDFAETDQNRDPFRSYVSMFAEISRTRVRSERQVLVNRYSVDELRLIGLVTRTDEPRAMLVDPTGRGWVVTRGQFIGWPEVVHAPAAGGVDYELNWRIDRIRDTDIVLTREDPAHPDVAPATRVISLRPDKDIGNEMQSP